MDNTLLMAPATHSVRLRVSSVVVGVAMVFALLVLVQHRADAAPSAGSGAVAAAVAAPAVGAVHAQAFNFTQFICSILLSIRNAFARSPFFAIVAQVLNALLVAFGCAPSGA